MTASGLISRPRVAWLLALSLLLAPALSDVCAAMCAGSLPSSHVHASSSAVSASGSTMEMATAMPMAHQAHCRQAHARHARVWTSDRASHGDSMPVLLPSTHLCQWHTGSGAPSLNDARTLATRNASAGADRDASSSAPPVALAAARFPLARSGPAFAPLSQSARAASPAVRLPLRI